MESLKRLEIEAVQLALGPLVAEPSIWGRALDGLRAGGIRVLSGMMAMAGEDYSTLESIRRTGGVRPDGTWPANLKQAEAVARLAAGEGIGLVTFHGGFLPEHRDDPARAVMLDRLAAIADLFAAHGVEAGLETGQERAETLNDVLVELDHPALGVNFDPANIILYGMGDPVVAVRRLAPYVKQAHIKDAHPSGTPGRWGSEVPVGEGAVDWDGFFEVALSIRPEVSFVIERESAKRRDADIAAARDLVACHLVAAADSCQGGRP